MQIKNHLLILIVTGIFTLLSCNSFNKKDNSDNFSSNMKIEFTGTENFTVKNPKFKVRLFAHPEYLADAPATLISEKDYEQKSIPFTIELPVPKNAESLITPKAKGPIKYYISLEWDSDGNGKIDEKGDLFIDYDKEFPNVKLNNQTQKIYLKILK